MGQGNIVVFSFGTFFGKVFSKDRIPVADVLGCVVKGMSQVAGATFFHVSMLNEFIEKILVHERDRKGSIQTTQEVEIYFNFVGRFVPPAFGEVELTPEELEEIRKREERKDRLHQNYLKRKANGKQKEYEERTKAKKKAEIEARKQAIRTEDIARGVFIPVSSLPQLGPRKGA